LGVDVLSPRHVGRAGDVPRLLRLLLGEVRRREQLTAELLRRAHVDETVAARAENVVFYVVAERTDLVVGFRDLVAARRNDLRRVLRQLSPFELPLLPSAVEQLGCVVPVVATVPVPLRRRPVAVHA